MEEFDFVNIKRLGAVLIVSGPSGAGKSTICRQIIKEDENLVFSISCTTRQPRHGEIDGVDYKFTTINEFEKLISENAFIEHAKVHGNYYGTLKSEVYNRIQNGQDVLLDIDVQGALEIKKSSDNDELLRKCSEYIFIVPPNSKVLEERLRGRKTDSEEVIRTRLKNSLWEVSEYTEYEYLIINDTIGSAVEEFRDVLTALRKKIERFTNA